MSGRMWRRFVAAAALVIVLAGLLTAMSAASRHATAATGSGALASAFANAAQTYGVPQQLLMAISYAETNWNATLASTQSDVDSKDQPVTGQSVYGPMALFDDGSQHGTVQQAAKDLGVSASQVESDAATNVLGAAAVLADDAKGINNGNKPPSSDVHQWYGAVAKYLGVNLYEPTKQFADHVYGILARGAQGHASDGEALAIPAQSVSPDTSQIDILNLTHLQPQQGDYPLDDAFTPAGGTGRGGSNRPKNGLFIQYIVIHDTEVDYPGTVRAFTQHNCCSAHYVVDGATADQGVYPTVTQFVFNHDIAYHAGNYWYNQHSIGIEHVGFADAPGGYYTLRMYDASAQLVGYLAAVYNIPIDRGHILGHDTVPGPLPVFVHPQHWDPGPFWDWGYYLDRVRYFYGKWTNGAPLPAPSVPAQYQSPRPGIRLVNVNQGVSLASWLSGSATGFSNFTPVYADNSGMPTTQLTLGASDPKTWVDPGTYNARDFSCDNLPNATQNADGTWTEDTNSDLRAKAEFNAAFALLGQQTVGGVLYDQIDFNGASGWVKDGDTTSDWGVIVTLSTGTTVYGRPTLGYVICDDAGNQFSRAGQSYVAQVVFTDPATDITWYQIFYNHRMVWVPDSEVSIS